MKEVQLISTFQEYSSITDLPLEDQKLIEKAQRAMKNAYAPYSKFNVGAAVLLENGNVITGNNQENASYPEGLCAERVALFSSSANHPGIKMKVIAIVASSQQFKVNKPITPCGACRQVIAEYENRQHQPIRIIMVGESGNVLVSDGVKNLLPNQFVLSNGT